jgi:ecotin
MNVFNLAIALLFCTTVATARAENEMKAFPPAEPGMVRYVLQLPKEEDETVLKVQLIVGKTVKTDGVNRHFFGGKIEEEIIEGWGFPRYVVSKLGPMAGTLMAIDPEKPQVARFISLGGDPFIIRYNSRLPVVLYLPEGVEARYRIWRADSKTNEMQKG